MSGIALFAHRFRYDQKAFWRNPASVFFTVAFPTILLLMVFGCGMMVNTGRAAWQTFVGEPAPFERTPKFGVRDRREDWHRLRYQLGMDRIVYVELALAALNAVLAEEKAGGMKPKDEQDLPEAAAAAVA